MNDPVILVAMASFGLAATGIATAAALRGWSGWLELKRLELSGEGGRPRTRPGGELAELKARVRKLEAIASGVEL